MMFAKYSVMRFDSYILKYSKQQYTYVPNMFDIGLKSKTNPRNIIVYNLVAVANDHPFT